MKPSKRLAAGLAGALAIAGVAVLSTGTSANAFSGSRYIPCHLFFGSGLPGSPAGVNSLKSSNSMFEITGLTVSNPTPNAGQTVNVTLTSSGLVTGPVAVGAGGLQLSATVALSGVQSGTVNLTGGSYPAALTPANTNMGAITLTGSFVASGNGAVTAALKTFVAFDLTGSGANNYCDGTDAGTTLVATSQTVNDGDAFATSNYVGPLTNGAFSTSGFRVVQVASGAWTWNVPSTWSPYSGPLNASLPNSPGIANAGNPASSSIITQALSVTGPNAVIATSSGQNAGVQAIRVKGTSNTNITSAVTLTGSVWGASVASGGFTTSLCDVSGSPCDAVDPTNTLTTDGSGNINGGSISVAGGNNYTTGNRALKVVQGANTALVPVLVLGAASITISPASGGAGTVVAITGASFNPNQPVSTYGSYQNSGFYSPTGDPTVTIGTATGTGSVTGNFTVNANTTLSIVSYQGILGIPSASNPAGITSFAFNADRCVAYTGNLTGGPGCSTSQNVQVSITGGRLLQRAYVNATPVAGPANPINGITPNVNTSATQINLGTITTPLAPTSITGQMNDITVTDNRGGSYGWTLSATMTTLTGVANPLNTIANGALAVSPTCAAATNATAWDYTNAGKVAIPGFDDTLIAPGAVAGSASQPFSGTVSLCVKDTQKNTATDSSGGVYNITGPLVLSVPAFQSADTYNSVMTITLV